MPLLPAGTAPIGPAHNLAQKVQRDLLAAVITADTPISQTSYSRVTGVSGATVQRAAEALVKEKLIEPGEDLPIDTRGRPERALRINPNWVYIGLAIEDRSPAAGTHVGWQVSAIGVKLSGEPFHGHASAHREQVEDPCGLEEILAAAQTAVTHVRQKVEETDARVYGLGVSVGGHVENGVVRQSPNIPALDGQPLGRLLEEATGLPTLVENDVNALARRHFWQKGGRELNFTVVLVKSDGIGSASVAGGVYTGSHGMAGEFGHIKMYPAHDLQRMCRCGSDRGCLETLATPQAVARRLKLPEVQWKRAVELVDEGAQEAKEAFLEAGDFLGRGLAQLVTLFDPEVVYLLGVEELVEPRSHQAAELYLGAAQRTLQEDAFPSARIRFVQEGAPAVRIEPQPLPSAEEQAAAAAAVHIEHLVEKRGSD
ncbi:ROK family protein [Streptomyces sp. NRRL F-5527]|uniref:ROK family protein n=1 Tax=Streptomyces sp. NRRL F-5527 TaxID=1463862 RepID=UPI0004C5B44D|nr:ROK family protein [Streptomyces sp. NRRL F-5527]